MVLWAAAALALCGGVLWWQRHARSEEDKRISTRRELEGEVVLRTGREQFLDLGDLTAVWVPAEDGAEMESTTRPLVVLLHGMYHGAWHWRGLQEILARRGFSSAALELRPSFFATLEAHSSQVAAALRALSTAVDHLGPSPDTADEGGKKLVEIVIVGHSQGGIILQDVLHSHVAPDEASFPRVCAAVLVATAALGQAKLVELTASSVRQAVVRAGGWRPYLKMVLTMRALDNVPVMRSIFARDTTTSSTVTGREMSMRQYTTLLALAPADGWPTYVSHAYRSRWARELPPRRFGPAAPPVLSVHFGHDQCYPAPHATWLRDHYSADSLDVGNQAHCFVDPGWEEAFASPLIDWIDRNAK
jgi:pimeloyl-ACP methyl ester carboxylesterase